MKLSVNYETKYKELLEATREYLDAHHRWLEHSGCSYGEASQSVATQYSFAYEKLEELVSDEQK